MPRSKKNKISHKELKSQYRNSLLVVSFILITAGLIGFITNSMQNKNKETSTVITPISFPTKLNFLEKPTPKNNILNVLSASTASIMEKLSPTPTPLSTFHESKFQFSFEVPKGASVKETDPTQTILVANSSGGAFIEIPESLQVEIAVVKLLGLNINQYYTNRLAMLFNETVLAEKKSTESAIQKKYELELQKNDTLQEETLILLPFKGDQIFEIQAVYLNPNHVREDKIFEGLIQSLKPY